MYASIRKYKVTAGKYDEIVRRSPEFVAEIRKLQGFSDYYWVRLGPDSYLTISLFEDQRQCEASVQLARSWLKQQNLSQYYLGETEVSGGDLEVEEHLAGARPPAGKGAYPIQPPVH